MIKYTLLTIKITEKITHNSQINYVNVLKTYTLFTKTQNGLLNDT